MNKFIFCISIITLSIAQKIPLRLVKQNPISNGIISLQNLTNFQYQADLNLGSPIQYANFAFDTAIGYAWINTVNGHYEVSYSTTANLTTNSASFDYGMGEIGGFQGTELLTISTITNVTMPLIFANYVNNTGVVADGVLGLSNDNTYKNPFELAVIAGTITNSMFGFYLKDPSAQSTAQFYICSTSFPTTTTITWFPSSMTAYWALAITSTTIGATTYPAGTADSQAFIDSGTAILLIGNASYNGLIQDQTINKLCQLGSLFYVCKCPSYTLMTYPNIQFSTSNSNLTVVPNDYMLQLTGGYCVMAVDQQNQLIAMLLGDSLLNNYFVAYDKSQNRIGFSQPLATTSSLDEKKKKFLSKQN